VWLYDAISQKERNNDSVSLRVDLEVSCREGMVALLSHLSTVGYDSGDLSNEICFSSVPIGNEIALSAIVFLGRSSSELPLEALSRAYSDVKYSAIALLGGAVDQEYLISAPDSSMRGLLLASILDICRTSSKAQGSSFAEAERDLLFSCPIGSESDISRAIMRSTAEFFTKDEEQVVGRAATAVHNAIFRLDASYQSSGHSKFVSGLAPFGRAWVHFGLARLSLAAVRLSSSGSIDPAVMAGAEAEWLKKSAIDSFAMCYAYKAIK
jgi:hypothetical protein